MGEVRVPGKRIRQPFHSIRKKKMWQFSDSLVAKPRLGASVPIYCPD
jgi:hypothetical protein